MTNQINKMSGNVSGRGDLCDSFVYERIFMYGSLQFCGHIEAYFAMHTRDLMIFIVQPRIGAHVNLLRRYHAGKLVEERNVRSSQNIFACYLLWYVDHVREVLRFCPKDRKTLIFGGHPLVYFGMGILTRLRPLTYAYWIGDYFPSSGPVIRLFERVKKHYHDRVSFAFYLSDAINRVMNGSVVNTPCRRTVMWGMKPFPAEPAPPLAAFSLLFVGLVRPGQGLEQLFEFLSQHREYRLQLIGVCPVEYFARLQALITRLALQQQVFFPNRFYSEPELLAVARTCHVGLALYDTSAGNFTHYADPGKVKAYAEMNLPIIMTRISEIVPFVERFSCGVVIEGVAGLAPALTCIRNDYERYKNGVAAFNRHFEYVSYYRESFKALEACWA